MATPQADARNVASLRMGPSRKRKVDSDRQEELLRRLQDVLLTEGFAGLTVDNLAARLQCSKSTLYAIASSKESLVVKVLKQFFRVAAERVEARVAHIVSPPERIATYLTAVGAEMRRMSPACYADMVSQDSTRGLYALNSAAAARRVREFIQQGVGEGAFRSVHARFVGEAVSLLIEGIQHGELLARTNLSSGDAFTELGDIVLAALTNKTQERLGPTA
ncbi:TetR/AcrR family transcriptional regulator [Streptosporangium amethystogenes]|uniref:TetR/AcrR family transcriptional regulator n=1 Tax=Streptosporangium amethystogenes TaxID=2002 RepID=UPI003796726C